jgi:hypothetical protein
MTAKRWQIIPHWLHEESRLKCLERAAAQLSLPV